MLVNQQGLGEWMSLRKWIRLTTHWVVSDCDLGKVSVYASSRDCVGLHMHVIICICVCEFRDEILLRGGECETPENLNF